MDNIENILSVIALHTSNLFFKMGLLRPLFVYFRSFQTQMLKKNCRHQQDSNSDCQSRRRERWPLDHHYGPYLHSVSQYCLGKRYSLLCIRFKLQQFCCDQNLTLCIAVKMETNPINCNALHWSLVAAKLLLCEQAFTLNSVQTR